MASAFCSTSAAVCWQAAPASGKWPQRRWAILAVALHLASLLPLQPCFRAPDRGPALQPGGGREGHGQGAADCCRRARDDQGGHQGAGERKAQAAPLPGCLPAGCRVHCEGGDGLDCPQHPTPPLSCLARSYTSPLARIWRCPLRAPTQPRRSSCSCAQPCPAPRLRRSPPIACSPFPASARASTGRAASRRATCALSARTVSRMQAGERHARAPSQCLACPAAGWAGCTSAQSASLANAPTAAGRLHASAVTQGFERAAG